MNVDGPLNKICAGIQKGADRFIHDMFLIVFAAKGTGEEMGEGFIEFFGAFLIGIGGILRVAEGNDVDRVPEKRAPYTGLKLHSITAWWIIVIGFYRTVYCFDIKTSAPYPDNEYPDTLLYELRPFRSYLSSLFVTCDELWDHRHPLCGK